MEGARVTWIVVGMLVSLIGGGSVGWVSVPLWCVLLAGVVGFTRLYINKLHYFDVSSNINSRGLNILATILGQ